MKKRIISMLLLLALIISALPVTGSASTARIPIYMGDLRVDYLAEELLSQMNLAGKSDMEKIQTVYDWIIANCTRYEWDGVYHFDEAQVASLSSGQFAQDYQADLAAGRILLRQELRSQYGQPNSGEDYWDSDCNYYITNYAYEMMLKRNGNCGHFSALLAVLLGHLGYDTRLVYGYFQSKFGGEPVVHTWNYILVDGVYYWADVRIDHSNVSAGYANSHDYFMIADTNEWEVEHIWTPDYTDWLASNAPYIQAFYDSAAELAPPSENRDQYHCSQWAQEYIVSADAAGMIPEILQGADLTQQISRKEFAAVAVRLFEALAFPVPDYTGLSPFFDTDDRDVLRAYSLGVVNGMGDGTFAPDASLTREQAVTMLGRVYELAYTNAINGGAYLPQSYNYFTDHAEIFDYARYYVYFFVGQSIVDGMGDGTFAPKASMTREQAIKIAVETAAKPG